MGYIYKITNQINQKIYIGLTRETIEERWRSHIKKAKQYPNRYLYDAMNHYGYENFTIEQIEECDDGVLDEREIYWISYYNSTNSDIGYNLTDGGGGGNTWALNPHKLETGEKIRQQQLKDKYIPITKEAFEEDIQKKLTVEEMCLKYHCGRETVRRRCKEFFDCSITELRTVENSGQFIKVDINKEELYQDIIECKLNNQQIAAKYGVSDHTIVNRCKEFFNKTPNELRGNQGAKRAFIDNEELLNRLILEGRTLQEVASVFQMSKNTLVTRLKEKYQMNFKEYREYVKSKN